MINTRGMKYASDTHQIGEGSVKPTGAGDPLYASGDDKTATADNYSTSKATGGDKPHNNVQPSIVVYFGSELNKVNYATNI